VLLDDIDHPDHNPLVLVRVGSVGGPIAGEPCLRTGAHTDWSNPLGIGPTRSYRAALRAVWVSSQLSYIAGGG